jgi:hypothetical protein
VAAYFVLLALAPSLGAEELTAGLTLSIKRKASLESGE